MQIDLTNSELFESLISLEYRGMYLDLHNEYYCTQVAYLEDQSMLQLIFESADQKHKKVTLEFKEFFVVKMSLPLQHKLLMGITLDTFYRGRFEENGNLIEYSDQGKGYYYVSFDEDYFIELFSNSVHASF